MEFQDVVGHRRMVRSYDPSRPVPPEVVDRIVRNGLRAPSAGFSQGWGFLVLDTPADIARFRDAVRPETDPEGWFAARVDSGAQARVGHRVPEPVGSVAHPQGR
jgi:nitroreductase